jgi:hypothetical protein
MNFPLYFGIPNHHQTTDLVPEVVPAVVPASDSWYDSSRKMLVFFVNNCDEV